MRPAAPKAASARQAIILAGGKGTRLRERLNGLPKPLIDVGGVPLLERQILLCKEAGFTDILVLVNYRADAIRAFCEEKKNWGISVTCIDDGEPRGTAGAVLALLDKLQETVLVLYGDTMLSVDFERFWAFHKAGQADGTLFLHPNDHPQDSDLVGMDEAGQIFAFYPYPHLKGAFLPNLATAALYLLEKKALLRWAEETPPLDFAKDLFPRMLEAGGRLMGYQSPEYIKDCGTPARIDKVCADLKDGVIERANLRHPQRAVFLDRDGALNEERSYVKTPEEFDLLPGVPAAIKRLNESAYRAVLVTNQPVIARGECTFEGLRAIHAKLETLLGAEGAFLDRIYFCPHHPDKGFKGEVPELKIDCACRKPKTGMVEAAVRDLHIDLDHSFFIGDSTTDIACGARAGVKTILLETGLAGRDRKYVVTPDFVLRDLPAAVSFILDDYPRLMEEATSLVADLPKAGVLLIGGPARVGKSTFARTCVEALRKGGRKAEFLSLDRWLFSAADRKPTVMGRYNLPALREAFATLLARTGDLALSLPRYDKFERLSLPKAETRVFPRDSVLVVEGTIALSLLDLVPEGRALPVALAFDETARHERFLREYILRGESLEAAEALYRARMEDEMPLLEALAQQSGARRIGGGSV